MEQTVENIRELTDYNDYLTDIVISKSGYLPFVDEAHRMGLLTDPLTAYLNAFNSMEYGPFARDLRLYELNLLKGETEKAVERALYYIRNGWRSQETLGNKKKLKKLATEYKWTDLLDNIDILSTNDISDARRLEVGGLEHMLGSELINLYRNSYRIEALETAMNRSEGAAETIAIMIGRASNPEFIERILMDIIFKNDILSEEQVQRIFHGDSMDLSFLLGKYKIDRVSAIYENLISEVEGLALYGHPLKEVFLENPRNMGVTTEKWKFNLSLVKYFASSGMFEELGEMMSKLIPRDKFKLCVNTIKSLNINAVEYVMSLPEAPDRIEEYKAVAESMVKDYDRRDYKQFFRLDRISKRESANSDSFDLVDIDDIESLKSKSISTTLARKLLPAARSERAARFLVYKIGDMRTPYFNIALNNAEYHGREEVIDYLQRLKDVLV